MWPFYLVSICLFRYHQYFCTQLKNKCPAYQVEVTLIVPWWCKGVLVISVTLLL